MNLGITTLQVVNSNLSLTLISAAAFENITGGNGNDLLTGNSLANVLTGNGGQDTLTGLAGNDSLIGGAGGDTYVFDLDVAAGADVLSDSDGVDLLDFSQTATLGIVLDLTLNTAQVLNSRLTLTLDAGTVIENVSATAMNDTVLGNSASNRLLGNAGHDILVGAGGDDSIEGGTGRDLVLGGLGADQLSGGADDDILIAGTTSWDASAASLNTIRTEWTSVRTYNQRTTNIRTGVGAPTVSLKAGVNALNDTSAGDVLTGDAGQDWYFKAADDLFGSLLDGNEVLEVL